MVPRLADQRSTDTACADRCSDESCHATFDGAPPASRRANRMRRTPGPPVPRPRDRPRGLRLRGHPLGRGDRPRPRRPSTPSRRRTGAEVVVYTQDAGDYGVTTDETEAQARALIDQWGIGRRGLRRRHGRLLRHRPVLEHGQVQLYAAPGFEATYLTNAERQAIFENDMLPVPAARPTSTARSMSRCDGSMPPRRRSTPPSSRPARQVNAVAGPDRRPDRLPRAGRLGVPLLAPLWQGPGLPRRSVDPHAGPAAGPDRGIGRVRDGRPVVAPGADDRDARPRSRGPDLVPRGARACSGCRTRSASIPTRTAGDAIEEAQRARNARRPIGPGRAVRAPRAASSRAAGEDDAFIERRRPARSSDRTSPSSTRRSRAMSCKRGWLVEKPSKVVARWMWPRVPRAGRRDRWRSSAASMSRIRAGPDRRRGDRRRRRACCPRPEHARGDDARRDDPGDARTPIDARCRRRWSRRDRCSRSSTRPGWTGSRRRTRPSCGARRSGCRATSRRSWSAASRTSARARQLGIVDVLPGLVPDVERIVVRERRRGRQRRRACSPTRPCPTSAG